MSISRTTKKIIFFTSIVIIAFIVVLFLASSSQAKFVASEQSTIGVVASEYYFTSYLLEETTAGGEIKQVELYGSNEEFNVNIYNTFEGKQSDVDIEFKVTLIIEGENLSTETHPNGTYCTLSGKNMECAEDYTNVQTEVSGTLFAGDSQAIITIYPQQNTQTITVIAESTAPYSKTLEATFNCANPQAIQEDVDTITVLHENYTELLVVVSENFAGDVKVVIGTLQDMQTTYFVRDIDVAKKVRYGDQGGETYENYAVQYAEDSSSVDLNAIFYFYLSEIFATDSVAGEAYNFSSGSIKANRTYVIDFLGELAVASVTIESDGTAVILLETDEWVSEQD